MKKIGSFESTSLQFWSRCLVHFNTLFSAVSSPILVGPETGKMVFRMLKCLLEYLSKQIGFFYILVPRSFKIILPVGLGTSFVS